MFGDFDDALVCCDECPTESGLWTLVHRCTPHLVMT